MQLDAFTTWLGQQPDDHPALAGFNRILGEVHDDATKTGSRLGLSGDDRSFLDGRQSACQDAMETLARLRQDAQEALRTPERATTGG